MRTETLEKVTERALCDLRSATWLRVRGQDPTIFMRFMNSSIVLDDGCSHGDAFMAGLRVGWEMHVETLAQDAGPIA